MFRMLGMRRKAPHLVTNHLWQCGVVHVSHQQPIAQRSIRTQQGIALLPREQTLQPGRTTMRRQHRRTGKTCGQIT
jgi:hypothetical protein